LHERFEPFMNLEVPYLNVTVTIAQDRQRLEAVARTRRRILTGGVSLALLLFLLGAYLVYRDVRGRLELAHLKSEFVANISHELKTPLTTIRMFAETLFHGRCRRDKEREYLAKILAESKHLARADHVLKHGRFARCEVERLLEEAITDVKNRWDDIRVETDVAPGLDVMCDAELVTVALANILDNAAKYGPSGQVVRIRASRAADLVRIAVTDEGRGIPADDQAKIFERFYRAKNVQDCKGMGLGLYLVRRIAELHGGRIDFESRESHGSTFTLVLPAVRAVSATVPAGREAEGRA
jgi:signal transduction histidine kinase